MEIGNYYIFNHRIPHSTINTTSKPRALLVLEFIPVDSDVNNIFQYHNVSPEELEPLVPPIL